MAGEAIRLTSRSMVLTLTINRRVLLFSQFCVRSLKQQRSFALQQRTQMPNKVVRREHRSRCSQKAETTNFTGLDSGCRDAHSARQTIFSTIFLEILAPILTAMYLAVRLADQLLKTNFSSFMLMKDGMNHLR